MDILTDMMAHAACEFCGSQAKPLRICSECGRYYCQDCAADGEGDTIEEQCRLCDLYADWAASNNGRHWVFTGRIIGTTIDVHTAHEYFVAVVERAQFLAQTLVTERDAAAEPSNQANG